MTIEKPAPWSGASGAEYTFHVFGPEPDVPSRLGNYIYAKRNAEGAWVPIYMGHGDLAARCTDPALQRCIAAKGLTHVHLRLNSLESDREAELQDLLAHYANAFAPEGCHPQQDAPAGNGRASTGSGTTVGKAPTKKATTKKATTKKAPAKKAPAKKASAKKTPVKKAPAETTAKTQPVRTAKTPRPRSK